MNISNCTIFDCEQVALQAERLTDSRVSSCLVRNDGEQASATPVKIAESERNLLDDELVPQ